MQLSDPQLLTACIAIIVPLSMLLYSNGRITEAKETLRAEIAGLGIELRAEIAGLQIEMQASKSEILTAIEALSLKIDNALEKHVLEYHSRGK